MAFGGDFGKFFLGGASTGQVVSGASAALGLSPLKAVALGNAAQSGAEFIS